MLFRYLCVFVLLILCIDSPAQSIKKLKEDAKAFFDKGRYQQALTKYQNIQYQRSNDMEVRRLIGACSYHLLKTEQAKKYLHFVLENDKKPHQDNYLYLARTYHAELNFKEAVRYYKAYLKNIKDNHPNRSWIKDEIRRCGTGIRQVAKDQSAIVENLGELVNSTGDDYAPVLSPNNDEKIYFSSARRGNEGGMRNDDGHIDSKFGAFKSDMYSTQIINGEWTGTAPMPAELNSQGHDMPLGFNQNGSVLYFSQSPQTFSSLIWIDTFGQNYDAVNPRPRFFSAMKPEAGDKAPQFFNDTIMLFASRRDGGYGGSDLYISKYRDGMWQSPENLGPVINSPYDETTPFLSIDGRTLYFSSNNLKSMGGMDIFKTVFDDVTEKWSVAENMGYPINSAGDDTYFKLSKDGYKAYFSSFRIDGKGKRDIYVAYFQNQKREQLAFSTPIAFSEVRAFKANGPSGPPIPISTPNKGEGTISTISAPTFQEEEITDYNFAPLFYNKDGNVLNYKNTNQLNRVAKLLIEYPQLQLILTSNSDGGAPINFDLYFSLKRAEEVAQYLIDNGVNPKAILVKGCGANYPIAKMESEGGFSPQAVRLNRRLDMDFLNTTGLPIRVNMDQTLINDRIKSEKGMQYRTAIQGLSYKVQIAAIKQMYSGPLLTNYKDAMVESVGGSAYYRYSIGLFQSFAAANDLRKSLIREGVTDAFIVPYVNGVRVTRDDSKIYSAAYPDLLDFLRNTE